MIMIQYVYSFSFLILMESIGTWNLSRIIRTLHLTLHHLTFLVQMKLNNQVIKAILSSCRKMSDLQRLPKFPISKMLKFPRSIYITSAWIIGESDTIVSRRPIIPKIQRPDNASEVFICDRFLESINIATCIPR